MIADPTLGISAERDFERLLGRSIRSVDSQQPVKLNPETWARYEEIHRAVPAGLPSAVSRDDLRRAAAVTDWSSPDQTSELFVGVMAWGSGTTNGRGPRYTDQALASGKVPGVLAEVWGLLQPTGADEAATAIDRAYQLHRQLPGVGPAFFTKLLWVVGTATGIGPVPLTLDARVWQSLGTLGWSSLEAAGGDRSWSARYVAYLLACEAWASAADHTPEDIEFTLFSSA